MRKSISHRDAEEEGTTKYTKYTKQRMPRTENTGEKSSPQIDTLAILDFGFKIERGDFTTERGMAGRGHRAALAGISPQIDTDLH
jgi:hypothetical protein